MDFDLVTVTCNRTKSSSGAFIGNYFHFETFVGAVTRKVGAAIKPCFLFYDLTPNVVLNYKI